MLLLFKKKMKAQELKKRISCLLFEEFLALEVIHMKFGFSSKIFSNKIVYMAQFLFCRLWKFCTLLLPCSFSIT